MKDSNSVNVSNVSDKDLIELEGLELDGLDFVELSEESRGHPENLASSKMCCCCVSTILPTVK